VSGSLLTAPGLVPRTATRDGYDLYRIGDLGELPVALLLWNEQTDGDQD
jgi:hypothetical protein